MYKFELHAHTAECDTGASLSAADHIRLYADKGYSGMVITDHYLAQFFHWFGESLQTTDRQKILSRWLRGYYNARNEGEKIGFTVLPGAELRMDGTINDYLIYGLSEQEYLDMPFLNQMKSIEAVIDFLPDYALVVQAHPFRNNMTVADPGRLFGIEVYNGCNEVFRNELAKIFAEHYHKAMTSGSDCHHAGVEGRGGILTEKAITSPEDLVAVLRSGNYKLIQT